MTDKSDVDDIFALIAERDRLKASNAMLVKALEDIARECSAKVHVNLRLDPWDTHTRAPTQPRPESV